MRLKVENIARVKTADIQIDGITVIAGKTIQERVPLGKRCLQCSILAMR